MKENDVVELLTKLDGVAKGTLGTVVAAYPDEDVFVVVTDETFIKHPAMVVGYERDFRVREREENIG